MEATQRGRAVWGILMMLAASAVGISMVKGGWDWLLPHWSQEAEPQEKKEGASRDKGVPFPTQVEIVQVPLPPAAPERPECSAYEDLRTMSTRWVNAEEAIQGVEVHITNRLEKPVLIFVRDEGKQRLLQTVLVMPGEDASEPLYAKQSAVWLQMGTRWCNREVGWADGRTVPVRGGIYAPQGFEGSIEVEMKSMSSPPFVATIVRRIPKKLGAEVTSRVDETMSATAGRSRTAVPGKTTPRPAPGLAPPPPFLKADTEQAPSPGIAARRELPRPRIETQDWRNVPVRDIRMVTQGTRHYVGGRVGDEDVQFELSMFGNTVISEELAQVAGASSCSLGPWVEDTRAETCKRLVPRITFGSVTLENVMVTVEPRTRRPILGRDLMGTARIYEGRDGYYLRVGEQ